MTMYRGSPPTQVGFHQQYIPWVESVFANAINDRLYRAGLEQSLANFIYGNLSRDGFDLVVDFLTWQFANSYWDEQKAQDTIFAVVEYAIATDALQYGIQIPEFASCYNWVYNNVGNVTAAVTRQPVIPQQQHFVNRGAAAYVDNRGYAGRPVEPNPQHVGRSSFQYDGTERRHQYVEPDVLPQVRSSSLAGARPMEKEAHVPNPKPSAQDFQRRPIINSTAVPVAPEQDYTPPVKIFIFDKRLEEDKLSLDSYIVSDKLEQSQTANIAFEAENNTTPILMTNYSSRYVPIPAGTDEAFIDHLALLSISRDMGEVVTTLKVIREKWSTLQLYSWISATINQTVLTALLYRYGIDDEPGFPYLTQLESCNEWLDEQGIREDIEKIALDKINMIFKNISVVDADIDVSDREVKPKSNVISMLASVTKSDIIVLPWLTKFAFNTRQLKIHTAKTSETLDDIFQQAFNLSNESTLYLDVYDLAMNRYRVFRNGRRTYSPNTFSVEALLQ